MEKLFLKLQDTERAVQTFDLIRHEPYSLIVRDASIQRFEYTFETIWKLSQEYLSIREGIVANSPKSVFRELLAVGVLTEEETTAFLEMTDDRNDTCHTYKEIVAETIFKKLPEHLLLIQSLLSRIKKKLPH